MRVIETSLEEDLSAFSGFLWQQKVAHRIFEERGRQVLEIAQPQGAEAVRAAYAAWQQGSLVLERVAVSAPAREPGTLRRTLSACPVLLAVLAASLVAYPFVAPLADGRLTPVAAALMIVDLQTVRSVSLASVVSSGEIWRWLTPIFVHFSVVHLLFNVAVTFDLGRRIESGTGSLAFAGIVAGTGILSNLAQLYWSAHPVFGGLSGVAYGLLGFLLVLQRLRPDEPRWQLPPGFSIGLLVFLVIFSTGITEPFGLHVANAAHWAGLAGGALLALLAASRRGGAA